MSGQLSWSARRALDKFTSQIEINLLTLLLPQQFSYFVVVRKKSLTTRRSEKHEKIIFLFRLITRLSNDVIIILSASKNLFRFLMFVYSFSTLTFLRLLISTHWRSEEKKKHKKRCFWHFVSRTSIFFARWKELVAVLSDLNLNETAPECFIGYFEIEGFSSSFSSVQL